MFDLKTVRELYEMYLNGEELEFEGLDMIELEGWSRQTGIVVKLVSLL